MKNKILFSEKLFSLSVFSGCLLLYPDVPLWSFLSALVFWLWRLILESSNSQIPSRFLTGFISLVFLVATFYSFQTLVGKESSTCFLLILSSLKVLEYREESEKNFLILLGLFIVISKFLFSLDLIYVLFEIPLFLIIMYTMIPAGLKQKTTIFKTKFLLRHLLLSVPMALFLYFFFPRFTQDWRGFQNYNGEVGLMGMSDDVKPGSVSRLIESNDVAFRAEFKTAIPENNELYWRGQVLSVANGLIWKKDPGLKTESQKKNGTDYSWNFKITVEPHYRNWLFIPEHSDNIQSDQLRIHKNSKNVFSSAYSINKRSVYYGLWNMEKNGLIGENEASEGGTTKINFSESILDLVKEIKGTAKNSEEFSEKLLNYYEKNNFKYTLNPGDKGELTLEDFIFKSKKGFCEHYASVSALLFRAAGYQSRVIAGYQGGNFNSFGNFWTILQKDAHAWTEFLNSTNSWVRFDATSVIAPLRLELGSLRFLELREEDYANKNISSMIKEKFKNTNLVERLEFLFENLNYQWSALILDYDLERQKQILNELNISIGTMALLSLALAVILSLFLNWFLRKDSRKNSEIISDLLNSFFNPYSLLRLPNEGPRTWRDRIVDKFPKAKNNIHEIFQNYIEEAYFETRKERIQKTKKLLSQLKLN